VLYFQSIYMPSWHGQGQLYSILYTAVNNVLQNNNPWSRFICVCWGVWLGPGSAVGQRNQSLCQGWPQVEGQGEWHDDICVKIIWVLNFSVIFFTQFSWSMWYECIVVWLCLLLLWVWQYRVVQNNLMVWKVTYLVNKLHYDLFKYQNRHCAQSDYAHTYH
jgi:hypothetical protein